jgi:hypothetical protein
MAYAHGKFARTNIAFTAPQMQWLRAEARRLGITSNDLVRRIVDQHRAAVRKEGSQDD